MTHTPIPSDDGIRHFASQLANMLIASVLPNFRQNALSLEDVEPSVSIVFGPAGGGPTLRMTPTLATDDAA